jgi:hypothetical protein
MFLGMIDTALHFLQSHQATIAGLVASALLGGVALNVLGYLLTHPQTTRASARERKGENFWKKRRDGPRSGPRLAVSDPRFETPKDAADQLRIVMATTFTAKSVLNRPEGRVFACLDRMVTARNPDWKVLAQVSLGEILKGPDPVSHGCINSKRVDLLLMDEAFQPRHVIEYHGAGHHQGTAAARDAVKKEALRSARIGWHEINAGTFLPEDLQRLVNRLVPPRNPDGPWSSVSPRPDA